jgi:hypothetical protein
VGLQPILDQAYISGLTCLIGMIMAVLGAIELYLGIQSSMELELKQSREFYTLAIDLYKTSQLKPENRSEEGKDYLNKKYSVYTKLCEASNLLKRKLTVDLLTTIPTQYMDITRGVTPVEVTRADGSKHIVLKQTDAWIDYIKCCFGKSKVPTDFLNGDENLQSYDFTDHTGAYVPQSPLESPLESPHLSPFNTSLFYDVHKGDVENQYSELKNKVVEKVLYDVREELTEKDNAITEEHKEETEEEHKEETEEEHKEETEK